MQSIQLFINAIDRFTDSFGRLLAWLVVLMMLAMATVVLLRYGLQVGSIALQESITYMHAGLFMLGLAYTLKHNGHVRVDIFYRGNTTRYKNWVNLAGTIFFLVPFSGFLLFIGWDYVAASWSTMESSREAGGLPLVFALKSLILVLPALLLLQSWSTARQCISALRRH